MERNWMRNKVSYYANGASSFRKLNNDRLAVPHHFSVPLTLDGLRIRRVVVSFLLFAWP